MPLAVADGLPRGCGSARAEGDNEGKQVKEEVGDDELQSKPV